MSKTAKEQNEIGLTTITEKNTPCKDNLFAKDKQSVSLEMRFEVKLFAK